MHINSPLQIPIEELCGSASHSPKWAVHRLPTLASLRYVQASDATACEKNQIKRSSAIRDRFETQTFVAGRPYHAQNDCAV
jgi:hypothetical protein